MKNEKSNLSVRWLYLALGTVVMVFSGVLYAWSILKIPFAEEFGYSTSTLALIFTLTMCCFCLGGLGGSAFAGKKGIRPALLLSAVMAELGFVLTSRLTGDSAAKLAFTYSVLAGLGIGVAYNVLVSTIGSWFPDKKGLCSGCLMMGFGASALLVGGMISAMIQSPSVGWRAAYLFLGIVLGVTLLFSALVLKKPDPDVFMQQNTAKGSPAAPVRDVPTHEMLRSSAFWRAFAVLVFLSALGNTTISFARDLALATGAAAATATTLAGVLSVCNGIGRIITGAMFDKLGRRKTMLFANALAIAAAGITLLAVIMGSLAMLVPGLCLIGMSYGTNPTISSAFTMEFYGAKYFATNFSVMNFTMMCASLLATVSGLLLSSTCSYFAPMLLLLSLAVVALFLNVSIRDPK